MKHLRCLQKIELAVRLRRGLNVVIGDVGTGKTTLCRQLILNFSDPEYNSNDIETHLLMDPGFTSPIEFLSAIVQAFGIQISNNSATEWQFKENIKNYLLQKGVDENKTVVLIIDEGQKLPDFCIEILREFLNYETNAYKLLQIVIFAQKEFGQSLKKHKNFADRVNLFYYLKPLNLRETFDMVRYRIAKAGDTGQTPSLFSYPGLFALYFTTQGYPRKIVTLCHQVILALIIQNRSKAGWFIVRSCAQRVSAIHKKGFGWVMAATVTALFFILISSALFIVETSGKKPEKEKSNIPAYQKITPAVQNAGAVLNLPAIPAESNPLPSGKYLVRVAKSENIKTIYELYNEYRQLIPSLDFLPYRNSSEDMVFAVFLNEGFDNMEAANKMIDKLPQPLASNACILEKSDNGTLFFADRKDRRF